MADSTRLTLKEFWQLPLEEQCRRYRELSDHDKFGARQGFPPGKYEFIPCNECANRGLMSPTCKAYPQGIPGKHIDAVIEDPTIECGNGYKYVPKDKQGE